MTFSKALTVCAEEGLGQLVEINDAAEDLIVKTLVGKAVVSELGNTAQFFIGNSLTIILPSILAWPVDSLRIKAVSDKNSCK